MNSYLERRIQSFGYVKFLQLFVIFGQMLFHRLTDKKIILYKDENQKNKR